LVLLNIHIKKTPDFYENDHNEMEFFKLIPNKKIEDETLYYNQKLTGELDFYKNLFNKDDKIYHHNPALKGKIILMFEGLPGTGKTAAVQQLARLSGRDLVHVNWQTFRGQYVGQSEKNLRRLLEDVDEIARRKKRVPVVMFNEAEAFLSQKIAIRQSTDRMENNLVSLLLEWLEKKDPFGIVIFTSNHRQLMDKAFERRISHIAFDMPDESTRLKIWESLLQRFQINLRSDGLAGYELTGAEISKVLRNYSLHKIAYDVQNDDPDLLRRLCTGQNWLEQ
jgi:SpoVK/Ycf46/Vps4 family AAA+-type ATPase